jgi:hypothetical protein
VFVRNLGVSVPKRGDIRIERNGLVFYFPPTAGLVISLVLSAGLSPIG